MTIFIPAYRWKMAAILMVFFMVWRINWAGRNILQRIFIIHAFHNTKTTVKELADFLIQKLQLNGVKIIGNKNSTVEKIRIPFHILGDARDSIQEADQENINCYLTMEVVDFTLAEYIRDSSMLGMDKSDYRYGTL